MGRLLSIGMYLKQAPVRECLDLSGSAQGLDISSFEHGNMTSCSLRVDNSVTDCFTVTTVPCGISYEQDKNKITGRWGKEICFDWSHPAVLSNISIN
jgi:hypothetical protein